MLAATLRFVVPTYLRQRPLGCSDFGAGRRTEPSMGRRVIERPCFDSRSQQALQARQFLISLWTASSTPLMNDTDSSPENWRASSRASSITTAGGVSRRFIS